MIISNIKLLYRKNKNIFVILILMQILIVCAMLYIISKINGRNYLINNYEEDITTFIVDTNGFFSDEIETYVNSINEESNEIESLSIIIDTPYNCSSYIIDEKKIIEKISSNFGVKSIDYNSWCNNNYIMLSVKDLYSYKSLPNIVDINGEEYHIIGIADNYAAKYSIVPYCVIKTKHIPLSKIRIKYKSINGINDMRNKYSKILSIFPGCNVTEPLKRNYTKEEIFHNDNIIEIILCILSILSEMYLYVFLIKSTTREYAVYELCGAKKNDIVLINFFILGSIFVFGYLSGLLIYKFAVIKIIAIAEPIIMSVSSIYCFLLAFLILLVSTACIFIPVFKYISRYQIVSVIREVKLK